MAMGKEARHALKRFRQERGLSFVQAAAQLHISKTTLIEWERGTRRPSHAFRLAIEVWTKGSVPADLWPRSPTERHMDRKAATVVEAIVGKRGSRS